MAPTPSDMLLFPVDNIACKTCGRETDVVRLGSEKGPAQCAICLYLSLDVIMGWNLIGTVKQGLAIRRAAEATREERERIDEQVDRALGKSRKR